MTETKLSTGKAAKKSNKPSAPKPVKPLTKVVVRCLPPTMSEKTFLEQIQPIPDHDHQYFMPADQSLGVQATCRAYLNFLNQDDVYIFKEKFDGYVFVDEKGNEYPAVVEFAPYQRMGRTKSKKIDKKSNTFEANEHYLNFLKSIETEETIPKLELKIDFENKHDNQIRSTPLLEYLNDKSHKKRDRDRKPQEKKILAPIREDSGKKGAHQSSSGKDSAKTTADKRAVKVNERPEKSEKKKTRRAERNKLRREKRQQGYEDEKKERQNTNPQKSEPSIPDNSTIAIEEKPKDTSEKPKKSSSGHRELKKYGERRQDRKKSSTDTPKADTEEETTTQKSRDETKPTKSVLNKKVDAKPKDDKKGAEQKESRRYSDRRSNDDKRRIRNKDRPALQIYQPSRNRGNKDSESKEEDKSSEPVSTVPE